MVVWRMNTAGRDQVLDKAICISLAANVLGNALLCSH